MTRTPRSWKAWRGYRAVAAHHGPGYEMSPETRRQYAEEARGSVSPLAAVNERLDAADAAAERNLAAGKRHLDQIRDYLNGTSSC